MKHIFLPLLTVLPLLSGGCAGEPPEAERVALVAPTPDGMTELRRCDDGGEGGVLIDGVCL